MGNILNLPAPANKIVTEFIDKISGIEPEFIEGIYITGSLAMNDFFSNKSDIDFLVLCKNIPDKNIATQLKNIHKKIARRYNKPDLSGSYLTSERIRSDQPEKINTLSFHNGTMRYGVFEMAAVSLSELKSNAITIIGPKAETLLIEIDTNHLNKFLYDNINSYWTKWTAPYSSSFKQKLLLFLFPRFTEWSVLGVARQLCTLQTGNIVSKTEAGYYSLQQLPQRFHPIIKEAIEIRKDNRSYPIIKSYAFRPSLRRLAQTMDCVNYIIAAFNDEYKNKLSNRPIKVLTP